ncbi:cyclin-like protein [Pluteus cervinus]|uniref:Cyclin-like protein n=1 Tax=Pluteus cervinus TaxID=181527 RepID=A0ACD3BFZ7_9AGAR|nr:cyclin-like protein [Pluteus cervinus]
MNSAATPVPSHDISTKIPLYEASTQFKHWRHSPEGLSRVRQSQNEVAVAAIRNNLEANEPGSSADVAFLTADEEVLLVRLYIAKITPLCANFRFPEEVEATAMTYLKRFYLKNTVMDWHPKNVMLTAVFLAAKTTNNLISLEVYAKGIPGTMPHNVLDLEFLVAQSLGFEFAVWHAHRALWGIWLDLQNLPGGTLDSAAYDAAMSEIRASRLTDVELIYTPSQIALACLSLVSPALSQQWAASKLTPNGSETSLSLAAVQGVIGDIQKIIKANGAPPSVEAVRDVDRRLRLCQNPEKIVGSKLYLAKQAEAERKAEEKRNKKAESVRKTMEGDPFGSTLPPSKPGLVDYDDDDDDED